MKGNREKSRNKAGGLKSPFKKLYLGSSTKIRVHECSRNGSRNKNEMNVLRKGTHSQEKGVRRHKKSQTNDGSTRVGD